MAKVDYELLKRLYDDADESFKRYNSCDPGCSTVTVETTGAGAKFEDTVWLYFPAIIEDHEKALERDRWIPVEERLPERYEYLNVSKDVLVIDETGEISVQDYVYSQNNFRHYFGRAVRVTHWRPLPQPPEAS